MVEFLLLLLFFVFGTTIDGFTTAFIPFSNRFTKTYTGTVITNIRHPQQQQQQDNNGYSPHHHHPIHHSSSFSIQLFAALSSSSSDDDHFDGNNSKYTINRQINRKWLMERFHFPEEKLDNFQNNPRGVGYKLLTQENSILEGRADWLQHHFDFKDKEMNKLIGRLIHILAYATETNLEPTISYCESRFGRRNLRKMVLKCPIVITTRVETIETCMSYLQSQLGWEEWRLVKVISKQPQVAAMSTERNLKPKIEWFQETFSLSGGEMGKILKKQTQILLYSIPNKMEPNRKWLQERLNLKDHQVRKIVIGCPLVLAYSTTNRMEPVLKWLQDEFSLQDAGLANMITTTPNFFGCSIVDNLEPTLKFYVESIETDEDVISLISRYPTLLAYSLDKRLIPRLTEAKEANKIIGASCLRNMAFFSLEKWERFLES